MSCRYYAHNGMYGALIPNPGSNQCGLIVSSHAPCEMEIAGVPVDENKCILAEARHKGMHLEPDRGPSRFHRKIASSRPVPNTRAGRIAVLECGHFVQTFGRLELATDGKVFCQECFNAGMRPKG